MKITNPATGESIAEIDEDRRTAVRRKYDRARAAQPSEMSTAITRAPARESISASIPLPEHASTTVFPRRSRKPAMLRRNFCASSHPYASGVP